MDVLSPYEKITIVFLKGTDEMNNELKRKPTYLANYDCNSTGAYFVTICTRNKANYFSNIVVSNANEPATVRLTRFGKIAEEQIKAINSEYTDVNIENYVIMPNHFHMIISVFNKDEEDRMASVRNVVRIFKVLTTKLCQIKPKIFQRSFYNIIIRNDKDYLGCCNYIANNPSKWEDDGFYNKTKAVDFFYIA